MFLCVSGVLVAFVFFFVSLCCIAVYLCLFDCGGCCVYFVFIVLLLVLVCGLVVVFCVKFLLYAFVLLFCVLLPVCLFIVVFVRVCAGCCCLLCCVRLLDWGGYSAKFLFGVCCVVASCPSSCLFV